MDEELKKLVESTAAETRRHFEIVAERLETKIEGVAVRRAPAAVSLTIAQAAVAGAAASLVGGATEAARRARPVAAAQAAG